MGVEPAPEGSMDRGGTDKQAETPRRAGYDGAGSAGEPGTECQAVPAPDGEAGDEAPTLLEEALRRENLRQAYQRVRSNGGAPGVDGMTVKALPAHIQQEWPRIREALLSGTYQPQPVRKVEIPKPSGGIRTLGIPTVLDRLIQQAVLQVLQPRFEPHFSEASLGFRPGQSAHAAVRLARAAGGPPKADGIQSSQRRPQLPRSLGRCPLGGHGYGGVRGLAPGCGGNRGAGLLPSQYLRLHPPLQRPAPGSPPASL